MRNLSTKGVKSLTDVVGQRLFIVPKSKATDIDTVTGEPCIYVQINGVSYHIACDKPTPIPYNAFCVLRDIGIMQNYMNYEEGGELKVYES